MGLTMVKQYVKTDQLEKALEELDQLQDLSSEAKILKSEIFQQIGLKRESLAMASDVLEKASTTGNLRIEFGARCTRITILMSLSRWKEALVEVSKCEEIFDTMEEPYDTDLLIWLANLKNAKGRLHEVMYGDHQIRKSLLQEAHDIYKQTDHYSRMALSLRMLAAYGYLGHEESVKLLRESLRISEEYGLEIQKFSTLLALAQRERAAKNADGSEKLLMEAQEIAQRLRRDIYFASLDVGLFQHYKHTGDYDKALVHVQRYISFHEKHGNKHDLAGGKQMLGYLLKRKGKLQEAHEIFLKSNTIFKNLPDQNCTIATNLALASVCYSLNDLEQAYNRLLTSFKERRWKNGPSQDQVPINRFAYVHNLFLLVDILLKLNQPTKAQHYHDKLEAVHAYAPSPYSEYATKLSEALILKEGNRITHKAKAQSMLKELVLAGDGVTNDLEMLATLTYCDLLISELQLYGEEEAYKEFQDIIHRLMTIAKARYDIPLQVETLSLQSQLALINGKFEHAEKILEEAQILTKINELPQLSQKVETQYRTLKSEFQKWKEIIDQNISLGDKIKKANLEEYIRQASQSMTFDY